MLRKAGPVLAMLLVAVVAPIRPGQAGAATPTVRVWDGAPDGSGTSSNHRWSNRYNWQGDVAPVAGDILEFPNSASVQDTENDLPADTSFAGLRFTPNTGLSQYTLTGAPIVLAGDLVDQNNGNVINIGIRAGTDLTVSANRDLQIGGAIDLGGHSIRFEGTGRITVSGDVTGTGADPAIVVAMTDPGLIGGQGSNTFTGATRIDSGTFYASFGWPGPVQLNGGSINASGGTINGDVVSLAGGGRYDSGFYDAHTGSVSFNGATSLVGGTDHVTGAVSLGDAHLDVDPSWCGSCFVGQNTELFFNDGNDPVAGTFAGLPDHARFESGGHYFEVSYTAGDGNDVYLRVTDSLDSPPPPPPPPPPTSRSGYWMVGSDGRVYAFGDAPYVGDPSGALGPSARAVDIEPTRDFYGYWVVSNTGAVYAYGHAQYFGGNPALMPGESITSLSGTADQQGYWLFTNTGRVFPYGNAVMYGDMAGVRLNGPVLNSVATPSGRGYYMVASDGGIFTFGDAVFRGSMGGQHLNQPVVGLAPDRDGSGYRLVAGDGGVFTFDASFLGSMGSVRLSKPMIGMVAYGDGYLMVASDGGIFDFSSKPFAGSLGSNPPANPVVGVASLDA